MLVDDQPELRNETRSALEADGYAVTVADPGEHALVEFSRMRPDIVVSGIGPSAEGFELLTRLRESRPGRAVPVILIAESLEDILNGFRLGADDCVRSPVPAAEIVARVRAKTTRPPIPAGLVSRDLRTGLLAPGTFASETQRELDRSVRSSRPGAIGVIQLEEMPRLRERFGASAATQVAQQVSELLSDDHAPLERLGLDSAGRLLVLLPEMAPGEVDDRLARLARSVGATRFSLGNEDTVRVTPVAGWTHFVDGPDADELMERAVTAAGVAARHLDLLPVAWSPTMEQSEAGHVRETWLSKARARLRLPAQFLATLLIGIGLPFLAYVGLGRIGWDVSGVAYWVVLAALLVTAASIWIEGLYALDPERPPEEPGAPYPSASAVIAAYLPNEAATILDTVEAFQRIDYPGDLQILVAYNTPHPLAVEEDLFEMARRDPRVVPLKVDNSTSKAQNVNAAMSHVTGEFVGMFDADHHPDPGAFRRAWRWLSNGYDVVQGHCVIRNGDASLVARTVAVEFESIYAVSHPGRTAMHGFGLFGGSNGYWRTSLLAGTRMHGSMLTEDIDSTLRILSAGSKIASDPGLISYELAPTDWTTLWKQRARWAQGWFQVSRKHLSKTFRSPNLSVRQKSGMVFLLGWREIYPWLSLQIFPVLGYTAYREGGVDQLNWLAPALVLATLFTMAVGPAQTLFAYRLAAPELRRHKAWFWSHLVVASLFYTEWKNVIARIAQIKELLGEHQWTVTPRSNDEEPARAADARTEVNA